MLEIVDMFREKGTVDELGISTIRDAFAEALFPATSTLHSRARYYFFVPWVYRHLEAGRVSSRQLDERARALQAKLVDSLEAGGEEKGVIGIQSRAALIRPPSMLYWGGLRHLGILLFPGSIDQYHSSIDSWLGTKASAKHGDEEELLDTSRPNWHRSMPPAPQGIWDSVTFTMTKAEGEYLRERILTKAGDSLLGTFVQQLVDLNDVERPWQAPNIADAPPRTRAIVDEAQRFSLLMSGAVLLYNLMLAEASRDAGIHAPSLVDSYRGKLGAWADGGMRPILEELRSWHEKGSLWSCIERLPLPCSLPARRFARLWITEAVADPWGVADSADARHLIQQRERTLKGGLARLSNFRALERWSGASGVGEMTYRWSNARTVIQDIAQALQRSDEDA